jgi:hypothetical protein
MFIYFFVYWRKGVEIFYIMLINKGNLDEMNKFYEYHDFSKCMWKEIKDMNSPFTVCLCGFFFLMVSGFELWVSHTVVRQATTWATLPTPFSVGHFQDKNLWAICLGCIGTVILLMSAS